MATLKKKEEEVKGLKDEIEGLENKAHKEFGGL